MPKLYIWGIAAIVPETLDTVTIEFDTGTEKFDYKAGQFINLTILIDGNPVTRSYSLSSSPGIDPKPAITVKKVPGGLMSNYIIDHADKIPHWQVDGPYGSFTYPTNSNHIMLLAAGSGITPVFSIGKSILYHLPSTKLTLIYANRTTDNIIFKNAIEQWKDQFEERVTVVHALSQSDENTILLGGELIRSRLNKLITRKLIKKYVTGRLAAAHYFICGPSSLIKIQEESLIALDIPADNIYVERFNPEETENQVELPTQVHEVMLHFYEQSNLLEVQPGNSILSAALQDRIPLPYSCKNGTCGKCIARLTAGNVTLKRNYVLRKDDLDAGMILLCQSYPINDEVTVEIG